ncbi:Y-family DNA polymerase [Kordiimonas pumila]|uniref:DNA-directed DNA polymerase n=1 Tax=Kordiimonas pumila TaxID=2161677 RepID=A0ABV7D1I9_9PROT|nr:type VI secretion protein ImpB [Kordiimonas pumila]
MRKPETIEYMYLDFDGFFAAVEEQRNPALHGKPVGVLPFAGTTATSLIAANVLAKKQGVKMGMKVREARAVCPGIHLVPQSPDLYEQMHRKLLLLIEQEIPITSVCSIDELTCRLDDHDIAAPEALAARIKARIRKGVGPYITCSIGMAANAQLAKIAGEINKPDGLTILHPQDLPGPLLGLGIGDIPGVGSGMRKRLIDAKLWTVEALWNTQPKQLRAIWGNVSGERFWYALHGYALQSEAAERSMFGHGRVLPPDWRNLERAIEAGRLLTVKAARRLRRSGYTARKFGLYLKMPERRWFAEHYMGDISDDHSALKALHALADEAKQALPSRASILSLSVSLYGLSHRSAVQHDMFLNQKAETGRWAALADTVDALNGRYAKTVVSMGAWADVPGGYAGGKIAFGRVPDMEDFW